MNAVPRSRKGHMLGGLLVLCMAVGPAAAAVAADIRVAVAANFAAPMQKIATLYSRRTGNPVLLSLGGTGKFYAQIHNGAPFDILLAADSATPRKLEQEGLAVPGSRFTYAVGKLVLWSARPGLVDDQGRVLRDTGWQHLAIADPKLAPYGAAAMQALDRLGLTARVLPRLVTGEDIGQTWQFVASGNADLGFVAMSQVLAHGRPASGSMWVVPDSLYAPIRQDAVLLNPGRDRPEVAGLLKFLHDDASVRALVRSYGYGS